MPKTQPSKDCHRNAKNGVLGVSGFKSGALCVLLTC